LYLSFKEGWNVEVSRREGGVRSWEEREGHEEENGGEKKVITACHFIRTLCNVGLSSLGNV
jgi:hypothetical protein